MIALFVALALQQGPSLTAEMRSDFDRVPVGGEAVVTVRAQSGSAEPINIILPPLAGLELVARSERSEVSTGGVPNRVTVLELRLRGSMPGKWRVGPARVRQGGTTIEAGPIEIEVTGGAANATATASTIGPAVQRLLAGSRPPREGREATVSILLSSSTAYVGEQVDVVTAAWFPRELRLQLRRPPTVQTPSIDGVYSYPQRSPSGIAASRQVDGRWFDLFVVHQIVFPLTPGQVRIPPATLHYSVPLAFQFFSQEERYAVHSEPVRLEVRPLPAAGRPADFNGGVGRGLVIERTLSPRSGRAGEPFTVDIVVRGEGNVPLWPPPGIEWPGHLRAYSEKVADAIEQNAGRLGGAKTFRYLVIPDSARTAGLPALRYTYFDPVSGSYATAVAPPVSYLVAPAEAASVSRASPAALLEDSRPRVARRVLSSVPPWLGAALVLVAPLFALVRVRQPRRARAAPAARTGDPLAGVERELNRVISQLVPRHHVLEGARLESALRAVGVEGDTAEETARLRDRIRMARYGPVSEPDRKTLVADVKALVGRLSPASASAGVRSSLVTGLLIGLVAAPLGAQALPPEQLYAEGALSSAASGFEARAAAEPDVPGHWFNLGATRFRMGEEGSALAAWSRAARLAPRDPAIRRALRLVPAPDSKSARALWVPPVTADELLLGAGLLWIAGWAGYAVTRRTRWLVVITGSLVGAGGALALALWYQRPLAVVTGEGPVAVSPHELAPSVGAVQVGSVVRVLGTGRGWAMVRPVGGAVGWLPLDVVEEL